LEKTNFPIVKDSFTSIVVSPELKPTPDIVKNTLYGLLQISLKIRAFSFTHDIVEKQKKTKKKKNNPRKEKGSLQSNIKKFSKDNLPSEKS